MPSMQEVMRQLAEMRKRVALVEEHHKAEVAQLREALAAATGAPQEETGGEQPSATETTQEGATAAKPRTEKVTNNSVSDPLTSAQQGGGRKPVTTPAQQGRGQEGDGLSCSALVGTGEWI